MFEILRNHIEKIIPLTDQEFEFIASLFTAKSHKKGQFLFQEGEYLSRHYFNSKGLLELVYTDSDAREEIVGFAMEDWSESDFDAFHLQQKTSISLICLEGTDAQ